MANEKLTYQINAATAFAIAFGKSSIPLVYKTNQELKAEPIVDYSMLSEVSADDYVKSYLGTPIMFPITLPGGTYKQYENGNLVDVEMAAFRMPSSTMVDFKRAKIVSTTKLSAGNGTVKEMYGFDDWQIYIRGLLINDEGHPQATEAVEQKKTLMQWENLADSLAIEGDLFADLNIFNIVIKDIQFSQLEGAPNVIPFVITAVSDEPVELI